MKDLLKILMNQLAYCNYCRCITETKEWDCADCGLSKPMPDIEEHQPEHEGEK